MLNIPRSLTLELVVKKTARQNPSLWDPYHTLCIEWCCHSTTVSHNFSLCYWDSLVCSSAKACLKGFIGLHTEVSSFKAEPIPPIHEKSDPSLDTVLCLNNYIFYFYFCLCSSFCVDLGLLYPKENLDLKYKGTETIGSLCVRKYITWNIRKRPVL